MHSYQITESTLDDYRTNKLLDERIEFLMAQANEQLDEIAQDSALYEQWLDALEISKEFDNIIIWVLLMSDEEIVDEYIDTFKKSFRSIIPIYDLSDLLLYLIHLEKIKNAPLPGTKELLETKTEGLDEVDHHCFSNVLAYVQRKNQDNCISF